MGMYTELMLGVSFKKETPDKIINAINHMAKDIDGPGPDMDHALFFTRDERWRWMLKSASSYYFEAKACLVWTLDEITSRHYLTVITSIKNYEKEWELFLDFIAPWVDEDGFAGYMRYEEADDPSLIYFVDGKVSIKEAK